MQMKKCGRNIVRKLGRIQFSQCKVSKGNFDYKKCNAAFTSVACKGCCHCNCAWYHDILCPVPGHPNATVTFQSTISLFKIWYRSVTAHPALHASVRTRRYT